MKITFFEKDLTDSVVFFEILSGKSSPSLHHW